MKRNLKYDREVNEIHRYSLQSCLCRDKFPNLKKKLLGFALQDWYVNVKTSKRQLFLQNLYLRLIMDKVDT